MATDKSFRHVVARQKITTNKQLAHSVKARVGKLKPHEQYYYRFSGAGAETPVGRFRTALPADSKQPVSSRSSPARTSRTATTTPTT